MVRRAGMKRERVTIEKNTPVKGPAGGLADSWAPLERTPEVWAEIEPRAGRERFAGGELAAEADYRVWLQWRDDVTNEMRLLWGSKELYIIAPPVDPSQRRQDLMLQCRDGVPR